MTKMLDLVLLDWMRKLRYNFLTLNVLKVTNYIFPLFDCHWVQK
jgi:hypothetical protein